ncbi:MAG TPA: hypothetical protein VMT22_03940, partial [Terriglobales bacterium]|nr:hypothetical protein [Terriglobales bacterium]
MTHVHAPAMFSFLHWLGLTAALALSILPGLLAEALAKERTIIDDLGFKIAVKSDIRRVVSLVPTNAEMVCLLDCARLIGGTRYDQFPAELR